MKLFKPTNEELRFIVGHDVIGDLDLELPLNHNGDKEKDSKKKDHLPTTRPLPLAVASPRETARAGPLTLPASSNEVDFEIFNPPSTPVEPPGVALALENDQPPTAHDVVCGRGPGTNRLVGNRRFRRVVQDFQATYLMARRTEKPRLVRSVVLIIRNRGGRFLRRDENGGLYEMGDKKAEAKTGQALREGLDVRRTLKKTKGKLDGKATSAVATPSPVQKFFPAARPFTQDIRKRRPLSPIVNPTSLSNGDTSETQCDTALDSVSSPARFQVQADRVTDHAKRPSIPLLQRSDTEQGLQSSDLRMENPPTPPLFEYLPPRALPATCKRCNHESCAKYKQSGCRGYCLKHAKLYYPDLPPGGFKDRRRKRSKVAARPPLAWSHEVAMAEPSPRDGENTMRQTSPRGGENTMSEASLHVGENHMSVASSCGGRKPVEGAALPIAPAKRESKPKSEPKSEPEQEPGSGPEPIDPTLSALVAAAKEDPTLWKSPTFTAAMMAVVEQTSKA